MFFENGYASLNQSASQNRPTVDFLLHRLLSLVTLYFYNNNIEQGSSKSKLPAVVSLSRL